MNTKCTKRSNNIPNALKIFQMAIKYMNIFPSKALKICPNWDIFGLKINHLATLRQGVSAVGWKHFHVLLHQNKF
jgi:hypothetical protein